MWSSAAEGQLTFANLSVSHGIKEFILSTVATMQSSKASVQGGMARAVYPINVTTVVSSGDLCLVYLPNLNTEPTIWTVLPDSLLSTLSAHPRALSPRAVEDPNGGASFLASLLIKPTARG